MSVLVRPLIAVVLDDLSIRDPLSLQTTVLKSAQFVNVFFINDSVMRTTLMQNSRLNLFHQGLIIIVIGLYEASNLSPLLNHFVQV